MGRVKRAWVAGLALGAGAAVAGELPVVTVVPLPDAASCYPGSSGTGDHVMFLRAKSSQADCDVVGGGSPCLARREFPGDGPDGRPVSLLAAFTNGLGFVTRPSVTGDGTVVAFAETAFSVCLMETASEDSEGCGGRDLIGIDPHSIAIAPVQPWLAIVQVNGTFNAGSNVIDVYHSSTLAFLGQFVVQTADPGGASLSVDLVDLRVDGRYLIADAFNSTSGLWGIYAVDLSTGATRPLVPPVAGFHIKNASLAQTSDDHIVFDVLQISDRTSRVMTANTRTGELRTVASNTGFGYPAYTGDDAAVVFSVADAATTTQFSLDIQAVQADRMTPVGPRSRWLSDGAVGAIYRRAAFDATPLAASVCAAVCGDLDASGVAEAGDVAVFRRFLADPIGSPLDAAARGVCDVIGSPGSCGLDDLVVLARAVREPPLPPGIARVCSAS